MNLSFETPTDQPLVIDYRAFYNRSILPDGDLAIPAAVIGDESFANVYWGSGHNIIFTDQVDFFDVRAFADSKYESGINFEIQGSEASGTRPQFNENVFDRTGDPDRFLPLEYDFDIDWIAEGPPNWPQTLYRDEFSDSFRYIDTGTLLGGYDESGNPDPSVENYLVIEVNPIFSEASGELHIEWQASAFAQQPTPFFTIDAGIVLNPPEVDENEEFNLAVPLSEGNIYWSMGFREKQGFYGPISTKETPESEAKPIILDVYSAP